MEISTLNEGDKLISYKNIYKATYYSDKHIDKYLDVTNIINQKIIENYNQDNYITSDNDSCMKKNSHHTLHISNRLINSDPDIENKKKLTISTQTYTHVIKMIYY